jgi:hypothetical protein
MQFMIESVA